ncbi:hypothetical protein D3C71_1575050 [compost metagenome]
MRTQRQQIWLHQTLIVGPGDVRVCLGQHHFQHIDAGAEERPLLTHLRQQLTLATGQRLAQRRFPAQPGRQHQAGLGPAENPRDRPQAFDTAGTALGRTAAQRQAPQLLLRGGLAEVLDELRVVPDHGAVGADTVGRQFVHHASPSRGRRRRR